MKILLAALLVGGLGVGCGGKKSNDATTPDPNTSTSNADGSAGSATGGTDPMGAGTPCAQEVALVCGDGEIDACLKTPPEGDVHKCVAP